MGNLSVLQPLLHPLEGEANGKEGRYARIVCLEKGFLGVT